MYQFTQHDYPLPPPPNPILPVSKGYVYRSRRQRITFTREQSDKLEETFTTTNFPDMEDRRRLAEEFGIDEKKIQIWFKNRRAKFRRQQKFHQLSTAQPMTRPPRDKPKSTRPPTKKAQLYNYEAPPTVYYSYEPDSSYADAISVLGDQETLHTTSSITSAGTSVNGWAQQESVNYLQPEKALPSYPTMYYTDLNSL